MPSTKIHNVVKIVLGEIKKKRKRTRRRRSRRSSDTTTPQYTSGNSRVQAGPAPPPTYTIGRDVKELEIAHRKGLAETDARLTKERREREEETRRMKSRILDERYQREGFEHQVRSAMSDLIESAKRPEQTPTKPRGLFAGLGGGRAKSEEYKPPPSLVELAKKPPPKQAAMSGGGAAIVAGGQGIGSDGGGGLSKDTERRIRNITKRDHLAELLRRTGANIDDLYDGRGQLKRGVTLSTLQDMLLKSGIGDIDFDRWQLEVMRGESAATPSKPPPSGEEKKEDEEGIVA